MTAPSQLLYLLLGANLGDRAQTLAQARTQLAQQVGTLTQASPLYETAAWGLTDQPAYLNQVLLLETVLSPEAVLTQTQAIEQALGRVRAERWGARVIDIDLLFYNDLILNTPALTLPHPYLHLRRFTLQPLADVAPNLTHPVLKMPVWQLLEVCQDGSEVIKFS
ncbi:2-amino-4-hydroxy-6-hydroxymethyldihydropteridine diphosphokinase [Fibrella aquatilis]|uniref:2-amino-4-hydroxy-6-hydroxymethyldihydropteridine pyrophosphokinase n=1 Tax=Fibrella aquatilis TaxID=2817059 RepID=A0A939G8V2_9BACT|nr:2-amino-4-hydroxy-6-hydroxymethyldihydropteridine diphosphokinase [Fibrella aquatilis]MBO0933358.1 2-amino-4-hydroxy-6-hydroxymethyldihydropteridine diphosphokinase [Fibrella aquatilis]